MSTNREDAKSAKMRELGEEVEQLAYEAIGVAIEVHRVLGPGFLESVYQEAENLAPIHTAQVLSYLKMTGHQLGLLINFNVSILKDGIKRIILS